MQDNNEEVKSEEQELKDAIEPKSCGCGGNACNIPDGQITGTSRTNPTPEPAVNEPLIVVPEGLEVNLDVGTSDLQKKLADLFEKTKKEAEARDQSEKEMIITGQSNVNTSDYVDVELPNGMTVKVHKDSHKAKQEDMARLIEAAGGEMVCDDEDDDGNPISHETELAPDGTDKAKTDYKPGMLRDLKAKFYPRDTTGAQAQARLADREQANADVAERFRKENEKYIKNTASFGTLDPSDFSASDAYMVLAAAAQQYEDEKDAERELERKSEPAVAEITDVYERMNLLKKAQKEIERREIQRIQKSMRIDWRRLSDPTFIANVMKKAKDVRRVTVSDGTQLLVTPEASGDFDKIYTAATTEAPDEAKAVRFAKDEERRVKVEAERAKVAAEQERIIRLTADIIPISPIENPSLLRRAIRTARRTWKRLVTWWRL